MSSSVGLSGVLLCRLDHVDEFVRHRVEYSNSERSVCLLGLALLQGIISSKRPLCKSRDLLGNSFARFVSLLSDASVHSLRLFIQTSIVESSGLSLDRPPSTVSPRPSANHIGFSIQVGQRRCRAMGAASFPQHAQQEK